MVNFQWPAWIWVANTIPRKSRIFSSKKKWLLPGRSLWTRTAAGKDVRPHQALLSSPHTSSLTPASLLLTPLLGHLWTCPFTQFFLLSARAATVTRQVVLTCKSPWLTTSSLRSCHACKLFTFRCGTQGFGHLLMTVLSYCFFFSLPPHPPQAISDILRFRQFLPRNKLPEENNHCEEKVRAKGPAR